MQNLEATEIAASDRLGRQPAHPGARGTARARCAPIAIDDLLEWAACERRTGQLFEEQTIVDYLEDYRQRRSPAPATYHRRFLLLRRVIRWASERKGVRDPFLELEPPAKPRQESDWLTRAESTMLLATAEHPARRRRALWSATSSSC
jgi:site-specific recombinase XerD